jgi:signal peptidase II
LLVVYLLISLAVILLDQVVKALIVENIPLGDSHSVISGVFSLTHLRNEGAAWSMLEGQMWFFLVITVVVVIVVVYYLKKYVKESSLMSFALSLILAGAIGNFIDRLRLGYVVDMFKTDFINFPIFNVADIALVVGVALLFIYVILDERKGKK